MSPNNLWTIDPSPLLAFAALLVFAACSETTDPGAPAADTSTMDSAVDVSSDGGDVEPITDVTAPDADEVSPGDTVQDSGLPEDATSDGDLEDAACLTDVLAPDDGSMAADLDGADTPSEDGITEVSDGTDTLDVGSDSGSSVDALPPEPDLIEPDTSEPDLPPPPADPYLLSIDNSSHTLQKVNVTTGATTDVCQLNTTQTYPSLTFSRFNGLYGSRDGSQLDRIDPCTCSISPIGSYGAYSGIYGITADKADNLFGVATVQDWLVSISTDSGVGTGIGALGYNFTTSGGTWSDADGTLYAINGGTDGLYTVDPILGTATLLSTLNYDFGTVGIELHPANGVIYACSTAGHLLAVDPNGQVTDIGDMGQGGSCTNLAAPWLEVPCLDGI